MCTPGHDPSVLVEHAFPDRIPLGCSNELHSSAWLGFPPDLWVCAPSATGASVSFIPRVLSGVEARVLCRFFYSNISLNTMSEEYLRSVESTAECDLKKWPEKHRVSYPLCGSSGRSRALPVLAVHRRVPFPWRLLPYHHPLYNKNTVLRRMNSFPTQTISYFCLFFIENAGNINVSFCCLLMSPYSTSQSFG